MSSEEHVVGSRAWAIEQLTPGFGAVFDVAGSRWWRRIQGDGYVRANDNSTCYFDELPVELPDGWALVT